MNPLISVIVPVYNVEMELPECVDSILRQTYSNLEIWLVDDGSTDKSGKICDDYTKKDKRVVTIHKKNGGQSEARNLAISKCNGDYIVFVDSDDIAKSNLIETLYSLLGKYHTSIACSPYQKFNEVEQLFNEEPIKHGIVTSEYAIKQLLYQSRVFHTGPHGKIYKRDLFEDVTYPVGLFYEDLATTYKLLAKAGKVAYTTEKMYGYRIRCVSTMRQNYSEKKLACIPVSQDMHRNVCKLFPKLLNAAGSRAFNVNRAVYLQIPINEKDARNAVWREMMKYRKIVLRDKDARKREKIMALCTYLGQTLFELFAIPYRKQQMGIK